MKELIFFQLNTDGEKEEKSSSLRNRYIMDSKTFMFVRFQCSADRQ